MGTTDAAVELTRAIGTPRLIDLTMRAKAGDLTKAEELALAILAGRADAIMGAVDAAQEEYANGTYRVPVKVVADWNKVLMVASAPGLSQADVEELMVALTARVEGMKRGEDGILVVGAGIKLEVYESATPGVEVKVVKEAA